MQLISYNVPDKHKIYFFGDIHRGTLAHNKKAFDDAVDEVKRQENAYMVGIGDWVEGRPSNHKFFDLDVADPQLLLPENQYENVYETIKPIKGKIIAAHEGNHDFGLSRIYGSKVRTMCKKLEINYATFASVITLREKNKSNKILYKIYCCHGAGTIKSSAGDIIRREANMDESLKRKLKNKAADCLAMFMGHTHGLRVVSPKSRLYIVSDEKKLQSVYSKRHGVSKIIPEDDRWYCNTGSFMKTNLIGVSTYSEQAMYDPLETGYVVLNGSNGDIDSIEKVVI